MAGFVLVPLAALLVLSVLFVIEKGKIQNSLPVDETGTFWLMPVEDAEDPANLLHCEVPLWAWIDQAAAADQETTREHFAAEWAEQMDAANHRDDREERWAALQEAHEAVFATLKRSSDELGGFDNWNAAYYDAAALCDAARDGWRWACEQGGFAMRA